MLYHVRYIGGPLDGQEYLVPVADGGGEPVVFREESGASYGIDPGAEPEWVSDGERGVPMRFLGYLSEVEFKAAVERA